jgi:hypothetical protein
MIGGYVYIYICKSFGFERTELGIARQLGIDTMMWTEKI